MPYIELIVNRPYLTIQRNPITNSRGVGYMWRKKGEKVFVTDRMMVDYDIAGGIRRNILRVVADTPSELKGVVKSGKV